MLGATVQAARRTSSTHVNEVSAEVTANAIVGAILDRSIDFSARRDKLVRLGVVDEAGAVQPMQRQVAKLCREKAADAIGTLVSAMYGEFLNHSGKYGQSDKEAIYERINKAVDVVNDFKEYGIMTKTNERLLFGRRPSEGMPSIRDNIMTCIPAIVIRWKYPEVADIVNLMSKSFGLSTREAHAEVNRQVVVGLKKLADVVDRDIGVSLKPKSVSESFFTNFASIVSTLEINREGLGDELVQAVMELIADDFRTNRSSFRETIERLSVLKLTADDIDNRLPGVLSDCLGSEERAKQLLDEIKRSLQPRHSAQR